MSHHSAEYSCATSRIVAAVDTLSAVEVRGALESCQTHIAFKFKPSNILYATSSLRARDGLDTKPSSAMEPCTEVARLPTCRIRCSDWSAEVTFPNQANASTTEDHLPSPALF